MNTAISKFYANKKKITQQECNKLIKIDRKDMIQEISILNKCCSFDSSENPESWFSQKY